MKIKAVRLRDVGCFRKPVALEGFSGGLDVLAGDNEFGKSTIFRALKFVLLNKHTTKGSALTALASRDGGAPLIEADIELPDGVWRITKQFGRAKRSELQCLTGNGDVVRGPDADERLFELLGVDGGGQAGRFNLLWVAQKDGLVAPQLDFDGVKNKAVDRGERSIVMQAIDSEIATIAGGPLARDVRRRVEAARDTLVTSRGAKKDGPLYLAVRHRNEVSAKLDEARLRAQETAQWRDEAARLRRHIEVLQSPGTRKELEVRAAKLRTQIADVSKLRDKAKVMAAERNAKLQVHVGVVSALKVFDADLEEFTKLETAARDDEAGIEASKVALSNVDANIAAAKTDIDALRSEEARLSALLVTIAKRERREQGKKAYDVRARTLGAAQAVAEKISQQRIALDKNRLDGSLVESLLGLERKISVGEVRNAAGSPVVDIAYVSGAKTRFVVGGKRVEGDRSFTVQNPIKVEVPDVGTISVLPAQSDDQQALARALSDDRAEFAKLLKSAGANEIGAVRARLREQEEAQVRLREAVAELKALAPDGLAALEKEVGDLSAFVGSREADGATLDTTIDAAGVQEEAQGVRERLSAAVAKLDESRATREATWSTLEKMKAETGARDLRRSVLAGTLGGTDVRALKRGELSKAVLEAETVLSAAERAVASLDPLPDTDGIAKLEREVVVADEALGGHDREAADARAGLSKLEGQIQVADDSGAGVQVAHFEGALELASQEAARLEGEVDALNFLLATLDQSAVSAQAQLSAPVVARLGPYLKTLFPDGEISIGEGLRIEALRRGDTRDPVESLSDGTLEQIAIVVRLAYARLLSESGTPMPLLLDDPLAYSDDTRIERVFEALRNGSAVHQVVVFTCRVGAFEALGGTRLALSDWDVAV